MKNFKENVMFQSTPSRRGRRFFRYMFIFNESFNPLPHAEGDTERALRDKVMELSFNPLPHAEGDTGSAKLVQHYPVSIHSLTQRETAPGRTVYTAQQTFQSTPSRRGRPCGGWLRLPDSAVSIHSLTQRETCGKMQRERIERVSIHSLTQRETLVDDIIILWPDVSIHSLTQRETDAAAPDADLSEGFNPLPHAEGDFINISLEH